VMKWPKHLAILALLFVLLAIHSDADEGRNHRYVTIVVL
jgi:hypothetical protein